MMDTCLAGLRAQPSGSTLLTKISILVPGPHVNNLPQPSRTFDVFTEINSWSTDALEPTTLT